MKNLKWKMICTRLLDFQPQTIVSGDSLTRPQFFSLAIKINVVTFAIEMREHQHAWLSQSRQTHCFNQLKMLRRRLVAPEGAFQYQKIRAVRELSKFFRISGVRSVDSRYFVTISQA